MEISGNTRLEALLKEYPWLLKAAKEAEPRFGILDTPVGKLLLKKSTVADLSRRGGVSEEFLIATIRDMIAAHGEEK